MDVGPAVGTTLGGAEGSIVGFELGICEVGWVDGALLGTDDGANEGSADGSAGLRLLPVMDGAVVGVVCSMVGIRDGYVLGTEVAVTDGWIVGSVGRRLGLVLGIMDG